MASISNIIGGLPKKNENMSIQELYIMLITAIHNNPQMKLTQTPINWSSMDYLHSIIFFSNKKECSTDAQLR